MRNTAKTFSLAVLLITLLAAGIFYAGNEPAESQQPQGVSFTNQGFNPDLYSFEELTPVSGIVVAMASCGNETCSENQCCCLNTDTGAQCCRPNQGGNCVESCKKSSPC